MTTTARILALLLESPQPLASSTVAFRLGIKPRQARDANNLLLTTNRVHPVGRKRCHGSNPNLYRAGPAPAVTVSSLMAPWVEAARKRQELRA